jgi:hypothetical protein
MTHLVRPCCRLCRRVFLCTSCAVACFSAHQTSPLCRCVSLCTSTVALVSSRVSLHIHCCPCAVACLSAHPLLPLCCRVSLCTSTVALVLSRVSLHIHCCPCAVALFSEHLSSSEFVVSSSCVFLCMFVHDRVLCTRCRWRGMWMMFLVSCCTLSRSCCVSPCLALVACPCTLVSSTFVRVACWALPIATCDHLRGKSDRKLCAQVRASLLQRPAVAKSRSARFSCELRTHMNIPVCHLLGVQRDKRRPSSELWMCEVYPATCSRVCSHTRLDRRLSNSGL